MKSLEVTDEQHAFVQHLREEISEQVVGKYGHVREKDAVQFLIDNLDGDLEMDGEFEAADVSTEPIEDGDESDDLEAVSYDESEAGGADGEPTGEDANTAESDDPVEQGDAEDGGEVGDEGEPRSEDEPGAEDAGGDGDGSTEGNETDGAADDDDMLDEMMSLLETHEDKWEESSSGDHRYSVELPDGSTEDVQTKDDVRAILFKNYR